MEELETRVRELEAEQELQELRAIVEAQEATNRSNQNITENIKKNSYIYILYTAVLLQFTFQTKIKALLRRNLDLRQPSQNSAASSRARARS